MLDEARTPESIEIERLKPGETAAEILHGVGIALGLVLLWMMEAVRDRFFRLLDRFNIRPRIRPASPFPPGQARKRPPRRAY